MPQGTDEPGTAWAPGDRIAGKYRVERVIGKGGMGVVLAARHEGLGQLVAIKLLRPDVERDDVDRARFLREARAAARIQSDHVARVFDVGTLDSGHAYMVMEHLDGMDLEQALAARGPLPIDEAVDHVLEALEAVAHAHAHGIVHRDLKPSNLFLARRPDGSHRVKVLDFGISKMMAPAGVDAAPGTLTSAGAILGSPGYMSPEQVKSSKSVDERSDIWAIGVVLHEIVTGSHPFTGQTVGEIFASILEDPPQRLRSQRPDAPAALEAVVARCLTRDRSLRYPDVGMLAAALAPFGSARTASLPGLIGLIVRTPDVTAITTPRISLTSNPDGTTVSETATTADQLAACAPDRVTAAEEKPRAGAMVETASTWSGRFNDPRKPGRSKRKMLMLLSTLGLGLAVGLALGWRATVVSTRSPEVVHEDGAGPPSQRPPPIAPGSQAAQTVVPTVEPAPATADPKPADPPVPSAHRPTGPRPTAAPSARAPTARKSPADLMKERD